ncbi:MAG TPA: DUF2917 domain-containing protein [Anaeromyxobacteraceae bacterium]|nr:DUF2917 domain-containing protein [Anaeromyxobacteraceae bacterium]
MVATTTRTWTGRLARARVDLSADETAGLPARRGELLLRVERGLVVVTREGDLDDHVLRPGEALRLPPRGKVVIWALEPALVEARALGGVRPGRPAPLPLAA